VCGSQTRASDTRHDYRGTIRRRKCLAECGAPRFTTIESRAEAVPKGERKQYTPKWRLATDELRKKEGLIRDVIALLTEAIS